MARPRSRYKCPHCGEPFSIRSSTELNPLLRSFQGQCQNLECGFTAQGFFELKISFPLQLILILKLIYLLQTELGKWSTHDRQDRYCPRITT